MRRRRQRVRHPRECDLCGDPYLRVNRVRVWTTRNPGHRDGWELTDVRACIRCAPVAQVQRAVRIISVRPVRRSA